MMKLFLQRKGNTLACKEEEPPGTNRTRGYTDRRIYWFVFLGALLVLCIQVVFIARGALAIGGVVPLPVRLTSNHITISNLSVRYGFSPQGSPLVVTRLDLLADNLTFTQIVNLPVVGLVTLRIHATSATFRGFTSQSLLSAERSNDVSFPTILINSLSLQNPTISLAGGSDLPITTHDQNTGNR